MVLNHQTLESGALVKLILFGYNNSIIDKQERLRLIKKNRNFYTVSYTIYLKIIIISLLKLAFKNNRYPHYGKNKIHITRQKAK